MSDMICLTETWLKSDTGCEGLYLTGLDLDANSAGEGKGVLTYSKSIKNSDPIRIKRNKVQIMKVSTHEVDVFNIYRSQGADDMELVNDLRQIINPEKTAIVCGDFNLCFKKRKNNKVIEALTEMGFQQLIEEASHLQGGHLDHIYSNHDQNEFNVELLMYSPYYTSLDHDAFCFTLTKTGNSKEKI